MKHLAILLVFGTVAVFYANADSCDKDRDKLISKMDKKPEAKKFCPKYQDVRKCYLKRALYTDYKIRKAMIDVDRALSVRANFSCVNQCWNSSRAFLCQNAFFNNIWNPLGPKDRTSLCRYFGEHDSCVKSACQDDQLRMENNMAALAIRTEFGVFCGTCRNPSEANTARNQASGLGQTTGLNESPFCRRYNDILNKFENQSGCPVSVSRDEMNQYIDVFLVYRRSNYSCATSCKKFNVTLPCRAAFLNGIRSLDRFSSSKIVVCGKDGVYPTFKSCLKSKDACSSSRARDQEIALADRYIKEFDLGYTCGAQTFSAAASLLSLVVMQLAL